MSKEMKVMNLTIGEDKGKVISGLNQHFFFLNIKEKWKAEMQLQISWEDWKEICSAAHMVTSANIWREFKWKVTVRYFQTPQITKKMGPTHR